jgi:hypothetical protein
MERACCLGSRFASTCSWSAHAVSARASLIPAHGARMLSRLALRFYLLLERACCLGSRPHHHHVHGERTLPRLAPPLPQAPSRRDAAAAADIGRGILQAAVDIGRGVLHRQADHLPGYPAHIPTYAKTLTRLCHPNLFVPDWSACCDGCSCLGGCLAESHTKITEPPPDASKHLL